MCATWVVFTFKPTQLTWKCDNGNRLPFGNYGNRLPERQQVGDMEWTATGCLITHRVQVKKNLREQDQTATYWHLARVRFLGDEKGGRGSGGGPGSSERSSTSLSSLATRNQQTRVTCFTASRVVTVSLSRQFAEGYSSPWYWAHWFACALLRNQVSSYIYAYQTIV